MEKEDKPWMGIMLSGISQTKINTIWYHVCVESKKCKTSGYKTKAGDSQIQRTNQGLPIGRGKWGRAR